jgi:O-antigen biosynthesis protein
MKLAVRIIELAGPLKLPGDIQDYDGVKLFGLVNGEVKGTSIIYNAHKALWQQKPDHQRAKFRYPEDFGSWLMLSNVLFSPKGAPPIPENIMKALLCDRLQISPAGLEEYRYVPPELPDLTASIVIPTKDRPDDLVRALTHLTQHKSRVPFEIVIVDNNPKSGLTYPVVQKFPGVKYVTEERPGVGYARNTGTLHANGDIMICTDDDVVVSEYWLDNLIAPFKDPHIAAVSSVILPYELETFAQQFFEKTRIPYIPPQARYFGPDYFNQPTFPDLQCMGNTSSVAFRYSIFADPNIGPFEVALGAGTKTGGGGDIYQFYKILAAGMGIIYSPKAYILHRHRDTLKRLSRQRYTSGSGFAARITLLVLRHKDRRWRRILYQDLPRFHGRRILALLTGRSTVPFEILVWQMTGNLLGPLNLWRSFNQCKKLGNFTPEQFAEKMRTEQPIAEKVLV